MTLVQLYLLGALAGLTIFLGLPFAALSHMRAPVKGALNGLATGILVFLTIDILGHVLETGERVIKQWAEGQAATTAGVATIALLVVGVFVGLVGIPFIEKNIIKPAAQRRLPPVEPSQASAGGGTAGSGTAGAHVTSPAVLSLSIAAGIGLHNFGEGLAIGQSAASGAVSLAMVLIVGFALHNMTEGFGIAAPLAGTRPRARFLIMAGLIAGGPTFIGTVVGASWSSPIATALFLSIAGGSLMCVSSDLLTLGRRSLGRIPLMIAVAGGFFAGYFTEMIAALAMGG